MLIVLHFEPDRSRLCYKPSSIGCRRSQSWGTSCHFIPGTLRALFAGCYLKLDLDVHVRHNISAAHVSHLKPIALLVPRRRPFKPDQAHLQRGQLIGGCAVVGVSSLFKPGFQTARTSLARCKQILSFPRPKSSVPNAPQFQVCPHGLTAETFIELLCFKLRR